MIERTDSTAGVSRRRVLGTVTGTAVSGIAGVPTAVVGDSGRKKRITTLASGDESRETVSVSQRWYRHKERAIRVKKAMRDRFLSQGGVHSVGIESDERTVGDLQGKRVRVAAIPEDTATLDAVPSSVDGIPVRTVERKRPQKTDCYTGQPKDRDGDGRDEIRGGGAVVGLKYPGTTDEERVREGTLCCRVFKNGQRYMLGARHMISDGACSDVNITGDNYGWGRIGSGGGNVYLGDVEEQYPEFDAALLTSRLAYDDISPRIVDESSIDVVGRVTGSGIDLLQSDTPTTIDKRGRTTCETFGAIQKSRLSRLRYCSWGPVYEEGQLIISAEQKQGDSGGPMYLFRGDNLSTDGLYALGIATLRTNSNGYARGSSANAMYKSAGISFGPDKYY